jgi:hypothetical protein
MRGLLGSYPKVVRWVVVLSEDMTGGKCITKLIREVVSRKPQVFTIWVSLWSAASKIRPSDGERERNNRDREKEEEKDRGKERERETSDSFVTYFRNDTPSSP